MKALLMSGPAVDGSATNVAEVPAPEPGPGQVAIDVAYAGINFIDVMARRGDPGYASGWPYVPGLEVAGTIRAVGAGVTGRQIGQRVAAFTPGGGLAQVALAGAEVTAPVPDGVALATAASARLVVATALLLLTERARLRPGETVLMHSASGGLGSVVSQVATALGGARRIGTVGRPDKIADGLAAGWDDVFARDGDLADAVHTIAPDGVDVVLDPTGTALLDLDLSLLAPGGRVVLFGNAGGGTPAPLPPVGRLIGDNAGIVGFSMSRLIATDPPGRGRSADHRTGPDRPGQPPPRRHRRRTRPRRGDPRPPQQGTRPRQVRGEDRELRRALRDTGNGVCPDRGPTAPSGV
ncbi:quinone oxidoreductase family protein [Amycolatopsis ruanii]|uniref:quinone oxidoreductase family protein n=1 Tax=Amycolatopsis ruanii TaxID=944491 RepID=UPI0019684D8F|nr:zinc-binding alcohol dehydrogenase family protein [Amycolatopsis ruanii]